MTRVTPPVLGGVDVCVDDIFAVEPRLLPLMESRSAIERFYETFGAWEPLQKRLSYQTAKTLVRKVASVHHALRVLPVGTRVVWVDFDSLLMRPLLGR